MSWLSALSAIDEAEFARERADLAAWASRRAESAGAELLAGGGEQEIALIAIGVGGAVERPPAVPVVAATT